MISPRLTPLRSSALLAALAVVCAVGPARAGDFADRAILGFSPSGGVFAFEQYGVQDGSGFPYAEIFVIDTARDAWVSGTPIRVRIDNEQATLAQARRQAAAQAAPILSKLGVADAGRLLARNPPSEISADPHKVTVDASRMVPPRQEPWTFSLAEYPLPAKHCPDIGAGPIKGFRLEARKADGAAQVWHQDDAVPESRGCPLSYAISDVIVAEPEGAPPKVFAVLVSVFTVGFEGPDRRFIAVTRPDR